jgi:hypothetical protein
MVVDTHLIEYTITKQDDKYTATGERIKLQLIKGEPPRKEYSGIFLKSECSRVMRQIKVEGKSHYLGLFNTREEAYEVKKTEINELSHTDI